MSGRAGRRRRPGPGRAPADRRVGAGRAAQDRRHPPGRLPANAARCAAEPIPEAHQHVVDLESRAMMCTCRPCYLLFTDSDAHLRYRSVPDRYFSFADFELGPGPVGRAGNPGGPGILLPQFQARPDGRLLSRARPAPPSPNFRWTPGRRAGGQPGPRRARPGHGGPADPRPPARTGPPADCHLVPVDACYELVGRLRRVWRGFDGGQEARDGARRASSPDQQPQQPAAPAQAAPEAAMIDLAFAVAGHPAGALRGRTAADRPAADHRATGAAVHAIALRCQVRILPSAAATTTRGTGLLDLFGEPRPVAHHPQVLPLDACGTMVQGFTGSTEVDLPLPCTFDFDVAAAPSTCTPCGTGNPAGVAVLRDGLHQRRGGIRRGAGALGPRSVLPAARGGLALADGPVLPEPGLDPPGPGRPRRPWPGTRRPTA